MKNLVWMCLLSSACITADHIQTAGARCTTTQDCGAGLFCTAGTCKANDVTGAACTAASDCPSLHACVSGHCSAVGCDTSATCNNGCCSGGQCVDGTTTVSCGKSGLLCSVCSSGASCTAQACVCAGCTGNTVCAGSGCADCNTSPCSGATPVCDIASHACQSCVTQPGVCTGATPFCSDTGACTATADSSDACARRDPTRPILANGVCVCDATTACPNNLACDTAGTRQCFTQCDIHTSTTCADTASMVCGDGISCEGKQLQNSACTVDNQCASPNICACADGTCAADQRVCGATCHQCSFYEMSTSTCSGVMAQGQLTADCTASNHKACDGNGSAASDCKLVLGQACTSGTDCVSGNCSLVADGTNQVCAATQCGGCEFVNADGSGACQPIALNGTSTVGAAPCNGAHVCNGNRVCKLADGQACTRDAAPDGAASTCLHGFCGHSSVGGTGFVCISHDCLACNYESGGGCAFQTKNTVCGSSSKCDSIGECKSVGTCSASCGSLPSCTPTAIGCAPGATGAPVNNGGECDPKPVSIGTPKVCCNVSGSSCVPLDCDCAF